MPNACPPTAPFLEALVAPAAPVRRPEAGSGRRGPCGGPAGSSEPSEPRGPVALPGGRGAAPCRSHPRRGRPPRLRLPCRSATGRRVYSGGWILVGRRFAIAAQSVAVLEQLACAATTLPTSTGAAYGKRALLGSPRPRHTANKPMASSVFVTT